MVVDAPVKKLSKPKLSTELVEEMLVRVVVEDEEDEEAEGLADDEGDVKKSSREREDGGLVSETLLPCVEDAKAAIPGISGGPETVDISSVEVRSVDESIEEDELGALAIVYVALKGLRPPDCIE